MLISNVSQNLACLKCGGNVGEAVEQAEKIGN